MIQHTNQDKDGRKYRFNKILFVSFGHLAHDTYSAFLGPMLPLLIEKLGLSLAAAGLLDVIRRVPSMLTPLVGFLADNFNLKYLVILTPGLTAICMSLLGLAPNYAITASLIFVAGISAALFHIPSPVVIKKLAGKRTASGMGYYMFGGELARTLGPLFITAAIAKWGLEGSIATMPPGLIASAILYFKLKDVEVFAPRSETREQSSIKHEFKRMIPFFAGLSGFLLFGGGLKAAATIFLTTFMVKQGSGIWYAGICLSVLQLSGAVSTVITGYLAEKIGCGKVLLITSIFTPTTMFLFLKFPEYQIVTLILLGFFLFMPGPVALTLVQNIESERPAFLNSLYMTVSFTISSVMTFLVGYVGDLTSLEKTFEFFTWLSFLSLPMILLLIKATSKNKTPYQSS
jgi:FSR family fosmidomycin resistance protein-like MFS transporter